MSEESRLAGAIGGELGEVGADRLLTVNGPTGRAFWITRLRWFVGGAVIAGATAAALLGAIRSAVPILVIGAVVLVYNGAFSYVAGAGKGRSLRRLATLQIAADIMALSAIIYFWGGIENPIVVFYLLPAICAGAVLPSPMNYLMASLATVSFGAVGAVQAAIPELYHPMAVSFYAQYFYRWPFVVAEVAALAGALHASVYFTSAASRRIRETEARILHHRDLLRSIISCMSEGLIFLAPDGTVLLRNPAVAAWFSGGPAAGDAEQQEEQHLPEGLREYVGRVKSASSPLPEQSFRVDVPLGADAGTQKFRARAASVCDKEGTHLGYVVVAEDVTEQSKLEEDLRKREREAIAMSEVLQRNPREIAQREKMVAVGTMAAGIGHEIGNPLASLSAVAQLLKRRHRSDEDTHHLNTLEEQIERIAKIVRQMLEFSRPAASAWALVDLDELIEQTLKMVAFSHRARDARIESVRNSQLPEVRIMPQLFEQVLVNLLLNAVDALDGAEGEKFVRIERVFEDGWVKVVVTDRGIGMSKEQLHQVFEPFYTTKPPGRGTGLGMAVSYRLVERQGGRIEIESAPGKGTAVTVMFRSEQATAPTGKPAASGQPGARS